MNQAKSDKDKISAQHYPIAYAVVCTALETALQHIADNSDDPDWGKDVYEKIQTKLENYSTLASIAASDPNADVASHLRHMNEAVETGRATVDATFSAVMSRKLE